MKKISPGGQGWVQKFAQQKTFMKDAPASGKYL
jgi:hypothetical protein